ncbi:hypothetical protein [Chitinophaga rhizosphaerae]|uniref:hypothetical protein n=1 Tax=Chitinophaga rhizosphaerae TaxID=1864947 RepID=UPI000F8004B4|nr:hypothetical protein [Chitinophaga rhizosphaerae]
MYRFSILTIFLLLTGFAGAYAQNTQWKPEDGRSVKERLFKEGIPKKFKPKTAKSPEAAITSKQALWQYIFPGSPSGPQTTFKKSQLLNRNTGGTQLPSNASGADAANKESAKAAAVKPIDLNAQGKEPSLHYEKAKVNTPKN